MNANGIISKFGGPAELARLLRLPTSTVASWGARGSIPSRHLGKVANAAREAGIDLRLEEFLEAVE